MKTQPRVTNAPLQMRDAGHVPAAVVKEKAKLEPDVFKVTAQSVTVTKQAGMGSANAKQIAAGLDKGPLEQRLIVAQQLVARLKADGPGFLDGAQRATLATALFQLVGLLENSVPVDPSTRTQSSLETKGAAVEWGALSSHAPSAGSANLRGLLEGLDLLDAPIATGFLEHVMSWGRNTGTNLLLQKPEAAQKVFSNWLSQAESRIDQTDFSMADTALPKTVYRETQSVQYANLAGRRDAGTQFTWSQSYPFAKTSAAPVVLFMGENGGALKQQFVDFVAKNAEKIPAQAAAARASEVEKRRKSIEGMMSPELRAKLSSAEVEQMVSMQGYTPLSGNLSLDDMVRHLRESVGAATGPADVQKVLETVLPVYGELLERVKSPELLPLIIDEGRSMLALVAAKRDGLPDSKAVDASAQALRMQLDAQIVSV